MAGPGSFQVEDQLNKGSTEARNGSHNQVRFYLLLRQGWGFSNIKTKDDSVGLGHPGSSSQNTNMNPAETKGSKHCDG